MSLTLNISSIVLLDTKEWFFSWKEITNDLNCEIPMSITCQIWKLLTPKHGAFFVQDNPWCECEK